jgi:LysM repeat protein
MKSFILTALLLVFSTFAFAQTQLIIQSGPKGLHLVHKVKAKESFYAIGRLYAIPPQEIAVFNSIDMNAGLSIGQNLMIPLTASNFNQQEKKGTAVYYVVGKSEGLFRVSQKNGTVLMASLRKWNNLSKDVITPGQKLIVGWLAPSEVPPPMTETADSKMEVEEVKHDQKNEKVIAPPVEEVKQKETKPEKKLIVTTPPVKEKAPGRNAVDDGSGGYFKSFYEQQVKAQGSKRESTVNSGIFKTASGWMDGKYYALIDNVDPGTLIKISNPSNNKIIYAKVLGGMSGIRQNQGYDFRISNAAASVLEITDTEKFVLKINY